jgi:hypothetical protein
VKRAGAASVPRPAQDSRTAGTPPDGAAERLAKGRACVDLGNCARLVSDCEFPRMSTHWLMTHSPDQIFTLYSTTRCARTRHVDAVNTFGVSAGHSASFRVVSRRQIQYFRSSRRFMRLVRFPAAPQRRCWSGPQALASFLFSSVIWDVSTPSVHPDRNESHDRRQRGGECGGPRGAR